MDPDAVVNATGRKISWAVEAGSSVIPPKYWPSARPPPSIRISISRVPPDSTRQSGDVTVIVAPIGAVTLAENVWADPLTLRPYRAVESSPRIPIASMLGRFRSTQPSGSVAAT